MLSSGCLTVVSVFRADEVQCSHEISFDGYGREALNVLLSALATAMGEEAQSGMHTAPTIDGDVLRGLSRLRPSYWLAAALLDWFFVAAAVTCCVIWTSWFLWVVAILVIGNRQHALGVLMHEGVHYRVTGKCWSNDIISDLVAGYPIFIPTFNYRVFHLSHHTHLDTPQDPEGKFYQAFPKESRFPLHPLRFALVVLRDLSGLWPASLKFLGGLLWRLPGQRLGDLIPIALLHGGVVAFSYSAGALHVYVLLWLLPMYTVYPVIFRIRAMTEHHGIEEAGPKRYVREAPDTLRTTRSIQGMIGRMLFGPHCINYHIEHHLYPAVPFYNLPRLSEELAKSAPEAMLPRIRPNYWVAIGECLRPLWPI